MLHDLQLQFIDSILNQIGDSSPPEFISAGKTRSAAAQMAVYRDSVFGGLTKAMAETYPVCRKLVGERFFDAMVYKYIQQSPSLSFDLNDYGEDFPQFIATFAPAASLPYLADVATLEWAWNTAFLGADSRQGNLAELAGLSEEEQLHIVFILPEDATLLRSEFPIHEIWQTNQDGFKGDAEVQLVSNSSHLIVWRQQFHMRIDLLDEQQWTFLYKVRQGKTFAVVCSELDRQFAALDIGNLLASLLENNWIQGFKLAGA